MIGHILATAIKQAVKSAVKAGANAIKKVITKATGKAIKAKVKEATKKAALSAVQKGLKNADTLTKSIKTIADTTPKLKMTEQVLKKPEIKSAVKDFMKQAEEDDKKLEDKNEAEDLPFDSAEETGEFKVDDKPQEEEEEPDEFIDWYHIPREVRRQIEKNANKGSIYDSELGDELIQNGFKGAHKSNIRKYIDDEMLMIDF